MLGNSGTISRFGTRIHAPKATKKKKNTLAFDLTDLFDDGAERLMMAITPNNTILAHTGSNKFANICSNLI